MDQNRFWRLRFSSLTVVNDVLPTNVCHIARYTKKINSDVWPHSVQLVEGL